RCAGFAPAFQRSDEVRLIGTHAAAAMPDTRHQKQPQPVVLLAAERSAHLGDVVDRVRGRRTGIGPTVIEEQLPTPSLEFREIRVVRFDVPAVLHRQCEVAVEIERHRTPVGILTPEVAERIEATGPRLVALWHWQSELETWRRSWINDFPACRLHWFVFLPERFNLCRGQAARSVSAL